MVLNVQIDPIEQRTGNALTVALHLDGLQRHSAFQSPKYPQGPGFIAATSMNSEGNVTLPAARATVTWPYLERWRINFEGRAFELGQARRKEDAVVRQARLSPPFRIVGFC